MMNKKNNLLVVALLCALFCSTVTQAQERLWGLASNVIFSVKKDGSDYQSFYSFGSSGFGSSPYRMQKLSNGEMLVVMRDGGDLEFGTISKITATGAVKLYEIDDYLGAQGIALVEGKDGYIYSLLHMGYAGYKLGGIVRISPDGNVEKTRVINKDISMTGMLTATAQGIYGLTKGNVVKNGGIYKLRPDLSGVDIIYTFSEGRRPLGRLLEGRDGYFYGTTYLGGQHGYGTIYKIRQDGSGYVKLHDFDRINGRNPEAGLVQDGQGVLYGTTKRGGLKGRGTLFRINEDGTDFRKLLDYSSIGGEYPTEEVMVDSDGFLYGSFYKIRTDGTEFSMLERPGRYFQLVSPAFTPDVYVTNPADLSSNLPVNLVLQLKPFPGATQYDTELSELPDFSDDVQKFSSAEPHITVTGLKHGTTYYTRVKPNIWPYYGKITSFTTVETIDQTSERLWGLNSSAIFSMNTDGSGIHSTVGLPLGYEHENILKLKNGEILVVGDEYVDTTYVDGTILKITPSGVVKLYEIEEYTLAGDIARTMVEGDDGYIYALSYGVLTSGFYGVTRFKLDGSGLESYRVSKPDLRFTSALTATTEGVYGVSKGNASNNGYIFRITPDAKGIDVVYNFTDKQPVGKLIQGRDGYLYGTTRLGGNFGVGTIYKVRTDGTDYQKLFDFDLMNGRNPDRGLVQDAAGVLYGVTPRGGKGGVGILFRINKDGTGFSKLLDFSIIGGGRPNTEVIVDSEGNIYGSVPGVGVYRIRTDGTGFQVLKSFESNDNTSALLLSKQLLVPKIQVVEPQAGANDVSIHPGVQINAYPWTVEYTLEVSESANFSGDILTWKNNQPSIDVDSLKYGKVYYARVKSDLLPYYGPVTWFTTVSAAAETFIIGPADNASGVPVNGLEVTVNQVTGATQYTVQLSENPDFSYYYDLFEQTSAQHILVFNGLRPAALYYARAKTNLSSEWGPVSTFTTTDQMSGARSGVSVYPNPSPQTFIYKASSSDNTVTVTDMSGAVVYQNAHIRPNESLEFGRDLKKGIYILRIRGAEGIKMVRLMKINN